MEHLGTTHAGTDVQRTRHRPRGGRGSRVRLPGLRMAASIALALAVAQIGARQMGATLATVPPGTQGRHCVAELGAPARSMRCYRALNAAVAAATDGRIRLLATTTGAALRAIPLNNGVTGSEYHVVSIEWTKPNYTGASLTWQAASPCGDYASSSMPRGWNDAIRSVAQYSGCATTLYWDVQFGGDTHAIGVDASEPDLGRFDANVSSQKWCPDAGCS